MAGLILPRRFTSQPQGAVDLGEEFGSSAHSLYLASVSRPDLSGGMPIFSSSISREAGLAGVASRSIGTATHGIIVPGYTESVVKMVEGFSILVVFERMETGGLSQDHIISGQWNNSVYHAGGWLLWLDPLDSTGSNTNCIAFGWKTNSTPAPDGRLVGPTNSALVSGVNVLQVNYLPGVSASMFLNGARIASRSSSLAAMGSYTHPSLTIHTSSDPSILNSSKLRIYSHTIFAGLEAVATLSNRGESLTTNPWQIFRAPKRTLYFDVSTPGIPTLSLPGVDQITTTGARPYVSLGF